MTPDLECLWAKSSSAGGLPLIRHMLDVASVAWVLMDELPASAIARRASQISMEIADARAWFAALIGCHDLGKATPGFQVKWPEGRDRVALAGYDFPIGAPDRHDAGTSFFLRRLLQSRDIPRPDAALLADAVAAHHGFPIPSTEHAAHARFPLATSWEASHAGLFDAVVGVLGASGAPAIDANATVRADLYLWLAGLCSVADWIGSSERFFPHSRARVDLADWFEQSKTAARAALLECGLASSGGSRVRSTSDALAAALPVGATPRALQEAVITLLEDLPSGPVLVVIEAPMGEGKTEAAFAVDAWLNTRGNSRGLYLAMPTQATSNALFGRVVGYLDRLGLRNRAQIQLAHGSASIEQTELRLREIGFGGSDATVAASSWLAGSKRTMLAANAVGTVDQALVSVLNAKHHFVRHFGLADRNVVFDEVHAYDTYTGGLIERLVVWLIASGSSVVLMSATLPSRRREALLRQIAAVPLASPPPYPRITVVAEGEERAVHFAARQRARVAIKPFSSEIEAITGRSIDMAKHGACVLVIVNKVARAQSLYERIALAGAHVMLFHARFPMSERLDIEKSVLDRFGVAGSGRAGWILVATQVAEQSLDVDFDVLISDIAPVDLILQRIGRIHRHARVRPSGFETPTAYISGLNSRPEELPPEAITRGIYDRFPVLRTAWWLASREALDLPEDIDRAVQWVYGEQQIAQCAPDVAAAHEEARQESEAQAAYQSSLAEKAALADPHEWSGPSSTVPMDDDAAGNGMARFGTRLGDRSMACVPIYRVEGGYSVLGDAPDWSDGEAVPADVARRLGARYLRVSHHRLLQHLDTVDAPAGWDKHSALAGFRALILTSEGRLSIPPLFVRLDAALGLVVRYESKRGEADD